MNSAPSHTTQTTEVKLPAWVDKASQENYAMATRLASRPYAANPWEGARGVAGASDMTNQGYGYLKANLGKSNDLYDEAAGLYRKADSPWDIENYLNPEIANVEDRAIANAQRSVDTSLMSADDKARKAGAFGGAAAGVERGVLAAEGARGIGDLSAELRKGGYDTAIQNLLAARGGMRDSAAGLTSTAAERQKGVIADTAALLGAGSSEQKQRQAVLDAKRAQWQDKRDYPLENLNLRLASLGMSPYGKTENVEKTSTSEKQGTDWATLGLGLLQMLPMLFSDRRMKKDIKKVGTDAKLKLPIYSYRFKGTSPKSPKMVGPMAQDVQKKYPEAAGEVGGKKVIYPGVLARRAA